MAKDELEEGKWKRPLGYFEQSGWEIVAKETGLVEFFTYHLDPTSPEYWDGETVREFAADLLAAADKADELYARKVLFERRYPLPADTV